MTCHFLNQTDYTGGYLHIPDGFPGDGHSKAWVVVDVHGAGGLKAEGRGEWLMKAFHPTPVMVLVPSFTDGYQCGKGRWANQLKKHFSDIQKQYPVHDRLFLHGHSGGAQFVHRFAFHAPKMVAGVSAHSAGSWAGQRGFGRITLKARHIPFLLSCGEEDTNYSVEGYAYTRIEWFRLFASHMEEKGFVLYRDSWPGVGHGVDHNLYLPQLKECFLLATEGQIPISSGWTGDVQKLAALHQPAG